MGGTKGASLRGSLASSGLKLSIAAVAAACLAVLLFALDSRRERNFADTSEMRLFQRTVGGLGMGSAAAPAWNLLHYDPRLQSVDDSNLWPVAGGYPYSPSAVSTAAGIRELPREDLRIIKVEQ
jgi:hypothetical protein